MSFTVKGCRISISYYFFAMIAALVLLCRDWLFFCGLAAASVHELGHIISIMLCSGTSLREISVGALGIRMSAGGATERPAIILSGVLANVVMSVLCAPMLVFPMAHSIALQLIAANICLALCNILPIEPLDGGAMLRCTAERRLSPETADRTVFAVSLCALLPLTAVGLFAVMKSRGNFSLLILCLWLLAGILKRYI